MFRIFPVSTLCDELPDLDEFKCEYKSRKFTALPKIVIDNSLSDNLCEYLCGSDAETEKSVLSEMLNTHLSNLGTTEMRSCTRIRGCQKPNGKYRRPQYPSKGTVIHLNAISVSGNNNEDWGNDRSGPSKKKRHQEQNNNNEEILYVKKGKWKATNNDYMSSKEFDPNGREWLPPTEIEQVVVDWMAPLKSERWYAFEEHNKMLTKNTKLREEMEAMRLINNHINFLEVVKRHRLRGKDSNEDRALSKFSKMSKSSKPSKTSKTTGIGPVWAGSRLLPESSVYKAMYAGRKPPGDSDSSSSSSSSSSDDLNIPDKYVSNLESVHSSDDTDTRCSKCAKHRKQKAKLS